MRSVSAGLRSGTCSLRSRPSTRTRGAEPTLQCRSEPPVLARACRNGMTDCVGWLTPKISAVPSPDLSVRRAPYEHLRDVWDHGASPACSTNSPTPSILFDEGRSHEQARPQAPFPQGQRSEPRQPSERLTVHTEKAPWHAPGLFCVSGRV